MSRNIADQISLDNVKLAVERLVEELENNNIKLFQNKPTAEVFPKGDEFIGISLIDDNNSDIKCIFKNKPRLGIKYLFFSIDDIKDEKKMPFLGLINCNRIIEQINADNAYNTNLKRVEKLLADGHNAVALVFLVSALENISKYLFFQYHQWWFSLEFEEINSIDEEILKDLGVPIDVNKTDLTKSKLYLHTREIDGKMIGILQEDKHKVLKWKNVRYWDNVHKVCKKLRVYDEYIKKKLGNQCMEIGQFEILKKILKKATRSTNNLNFQRIKKEGGLKRNFETFFDINLNHFSMEFDILEKYTKMRHRIIHGTIKDIDITNEDVVLFKTTIEKFITFIREQLSSLIVKRGILKFGKFN